MDKELAHHNLKLHYQKNAYLNLLPTCGENVSHHQVSLTGINISINISINWEEESTTLQQPNIYSCCAALESKAKTTHPKL